MLLPETFSFYFSVGTFWTLIAAISHENKTYFIVYYCVCVANFNNISIWLNVEV